MSARDATILEPGPGSVQVRSGVADVFYVPDHGATIPVATVAQGAVVIAGAQSVSLRIIPRIGCELERRAGPQSDDQHGVRAFVDAAVARMSDGDASALSGSQASDLPGVLDRVLTRRGDAMEQARRSRATESSDSDARELQGAFRRAEQDARHPGQATRSGSSDELITVLRVLGGAVGFDVPAMDDSELANDPRPVAARLPALSHACGVRYRAVRLEQGWQKPGAAPYLAMLSAPGGTTRPAALVPAGRRYQVHLGDGGPPQALSAVHLDALSPEGWELSSPLPRTRAVTWRDVARLAMRGTIRDWRWIIAMALGVALLGLLTPILTKVVIDRIVPQGRTGLLVQTGLALAAAAALAGVFALVQYFAMSRVTQRATEHVQPAFWDRVLSMPPAFFRDFSAGDLSVRVMAVDALQQLINVQVIGAVLAAVFALVNLGLMFHYSVVLGAVGTLVLALTIGVLALGVRATQRLYVESIDAQLEATSWVVQVLSGIQKIRLAGAETRMQWRYLDLVRVQVVSLARMTQVLGRVQAWTIFAVAAAPALFFLAVGQTWGAAGETVSSSTYLAFSAAYLAAFAAISALSSIVTPLASARPILQLVRPLMDGLPEAATHRSDPGVLEGEVEFRNVAFRYGDDTPLVLDRLSFHVQPGEMVALVGPSGSGKSTALRMVLGFDEPDDGRVLLDGRDLRHLDLDLVRRQMGVVIQDGEITRASILKNILAGMDADEDTAWKAAESAALADDIGRMPMQMQTIVDPQLLSGGQAQRLLLARALVRRPSLVVLDEATSALDNVSQAKVSEALDNLGATRIVVAHRLSTIKSADRILVVVHGRIAEQGTYEELMAADGVLTRLAERQTA